MEEGGPIEQTKLLHDCTAYATFFADRFSHVLLMVMGFQYAIYSEWDTVVVLFAVLLYTCGAVIRLRISFPDKGRVLNPIHGLWVSNLATPALLMLAVWFPSRPMWIVVGFFAGLAKPETIATCTLFFSPTAQSDTPEVVEAKMRLLQYEFVLADLGTALAVALIFYYPVLLRPCLAVVMVVHAFLCVVFVIGQTAIDRKARAHEEFQSMRGLVRATIGPESTPLAAKESELQSDEADTEVEQEQHFEEVYTETAKDIAWFGFVCEASSYAAASYMYSVVLTLANFNPIVLVVSVCTGTAVRLGVTQWYHRVLTHANIQKAMQAIIWTSLAAGVMSPFFLTALHDSSTAHLILHTTVLATVGLLQQAPVFIATEMHPLLGTSVHKHLMLLIQCQLVGRAVGVTVAYALYKYAHASPYLPISLAFVFIRVRYTHSWNKLHVCLQKMVMQHSSSLMAGSHHGDGEAYIFGVSDGYPQ